VPWMRSFSRSVYSVSSLPIRNLTHLPPSHAPAPDCISRRRLPVRAGTCPPEHPGTRERCVRLGQRFGLVRGRHKQRNSSECCYCPSHGWTRKPAPSTCFSAESTRVSLSLDLLFVDAP